MRHLEAFHLPSLQFWLASKIVRAVLAFHERVPNELACDEAAKSNGARNSFAVSSVWISFRLSALVICVSSDVSVRLAHLRPHLHWQSVMDQQLSGCEVERVHR